jgi:hypothetical protein
MFARMLLLLSFGLAVASRAAAQQHRSVVRGTLLGPDDTPVGSVSMRAIREDTGETRRFVSDADGTFTLVQLEPGSYRLVSDDDRFRNFAARFFVGVNDDIDLTLPLAMVSISSEVDYRTFVLEVESTSVAIRTRLQGDFLTQLPFDGRSLFDALILTPRLAGRPSGPHADGVFAATYTQDGFLNVGTPGGAPAVRPQLESVAFFEAGVPFFDAGASGGGPHIAVVTRAGTNRVSSGAFGFAQTAVDRGQFGGFAGGPVARNRTFLFGDAQHTRFSDDVPLRDSGTEAGIRLDHNIGEAAALTGRYSLSDGIYREQRGQLFGTALRHHVPSGSNDIRLDVSTSRSAILIGLPDTSRIRAADTLALALGDHAVDVGGEWQRIDLETFEPAGTVVSGFVQDHWRARPSLTVQAGLRVEWVDPAREAAESDSHVLPRLGVAWQPFHWSETVVRGAYGRFAETRAAFDDAPAIDQWSIGAARQWGRTRTIEVAYEGARLADVSRFNALVFEMEQRSEVGLTGHLAYTFGATDFYGASNPDEDPHHELTGAFTWWLPFGDERLLFSDGVLRGIFGDMQLTGLFVVENERRDPQTVSRGDFKTLDLGLMKNLRIGDGTLQLRFETFNTLNRSNRRQFFYPDLFGIAAAENHGRRYQVGVRFVY